MFPIKTKLLKSIFYIDRTKSIWLRALLCFLIAASVLIFSAFSDLQYDLRFQFRGTQTISKDIVILEVPHQEFKEIAHYFPAKGSATKRNNMFWHPSTWKMIFNRVEQASPLATGVSFNFPKSFKKNLRAFSLNNKNIVWSTHSESNEGQSSRFFKESSFLNSALTNFVVDNDGVLRRTSPAKLPHMATKLAAALFRSKNQISPSRLEKNQLINFRGEAQSFPIIRLSRLLEDDQELLKLHKKIVIISSSDLPKQIFNTPVGVMSKAELIATLTDNILEDRWITPVPLYAALILLFLIIIAGAWFMIIYPNNFALIFLIWSGIALGAFSLWFFDIFYLYVPIIPPFVALLSLYIIFLSFQLTLKDNKNWKLEQEKNIQFESEQLKSNFLSLISHDLKTPIAKIQAICDRIMVQSPDPALSDSLTALRKESTDLHRYIQSILQITRAESKDFTLNKESTDINEVILDVTNRLKLLATEKNITINLQLEPMFLIEIDSILIREVILNLVENSIKYTPPEGQISVLSFEKGEHVIISINDNGPGIPLEEQNLIFDKFYRTQDQKMNSKGSGLGLYLVKYFIELHSGEVFLQSQPGVGTNIGFKLPI